MVTEPESMDTLIYFTNRAVDSGQVRAWVYKGMCPTCQKGKMEKPKNEKTGRPKIRATHYLCNACGHEEEKDQYEETLDIEIVYTCPACKHEGDITVPYKRRTFNGVKAVVFQCQQCNEKIPISKKMKAGKK